mmetsp:Transcript_14897/g.28006  ORF Transcript_14897/g.28006 Transcript_14897/m.28006 type:complete len:595 (+) Transcript_14897:342-2126(+)
MKTFKCKQILRLPCQWRTIETQTTMMMLVERNKAMPMMMEPSSSSDSNSIRGKSSQEYLDEKDNDGNNDGSAFWNCVGSISRGGALFVHSKSSGTGPAVKSTHWRPRFHGHSKTIDATSQESKEKIHPRSDEPNIYNIPTSLRPEYQSLPIVVKAMLGIVSVLFSSLRFTKAISRVSFQKSPIRKLEFLVATFVYFFLSMVAVQDLFYAPSRISMSSLLLNNWLPSRLSKYSILHTAVPPQLVYKEDLDRLQIDPIGVHFVEFENEGKSINEEYKFDAIHFNHGFGASSLSWLPVIPSLVQKLHGKLGFAHDAPGFGFTDRPISSGKRGGLVPYSSAANAAIGNILLNNRLRNEWKSKRIALFGHSMGCSATLKMALTLPLEVEKVVVLVAPALVGEFPDENNGERYNGKGDNLSGSQEVQESVKQIVQSQPSRVRELVARFLAAIRTLVLDFGVMYVLRRAVGRPGFWKNGLRLAWGDPNRLTETDVLRFQWPSIGKGWEGGLLSFTRSRITSSCAYRGGEVQLLCDVLNLPNTRVIIVQGTKDSIVPVTMAKRIADHFQGRIRLIQLDGQGHDPFEESVNVFVQSVVSEIEN